MNQYACAITGHRPTRFCFGYNEEDPLCQKLKECLLEQFRILHDEKFVRTFFVGGALGVDMWAGEQLLTLRAQTGYEDIKIIVVVPFIGYDSKWPDQSKHRLKKMCIRDRIITAPVILALTLFVWLCTGLIYISGLVLGLLSTVIALLGVAVLITYSPQNGVILLVMAFLISPMGLPLAAIWLMGKVQSLKFAIQELVYG